MPPDQPHEQHPTAQDTFTTLARSYDAWYDTPVGAWADSIEREALGALLALQPGEHLLDLGCGTARMTLMLAPPGVHVAALDASPAMLHVAQQRAHFHQAEERLRLVRADMQHMPFPAAAFDAVLTVTTLSFVPDPLRVVCEATRVLRPGGRLVIGALNRWSLWALLRRLQGLLRSTVFQSAHFLDVATLQRLIYQSGLQPEAWQGLLHLPPINVTAVLQGLAPLEHACQRYTPALGAFLAVKASRPLANMDMPEFSEWEG